MDTAALVVSILVWLQFKHFVADYLLQPKWILDGKGDFRKPGGYVHAGMHATGSVPAFWFGGLDGAGIVFLTASEFAVHYALDHVKALHSRHHPHAPVARMFWVLHGADQFAHQLTYATLLLVIMTTSKALMR
jgi:hypothetical protein